MLKRWLASALLALRAITPLSAQQASLVVRDPPFNVHYAPGAERLAAHVLNLAGTMDSLPGLPGAWWRSQPIDIVLAPSESAFTSSTGGRIPEWGAGVAVPDRSLIVLPAWVSPQRGGPLDYNSVLRHEIAHLAVHRAVAPARVPRWFDEGYAAWSAGELDWGNAWMLRIAFITGRAPPLDSLELGWPRQAAPARLAYLLSATVIDYLVDESGVYGLQRLFERWRSSGDFEQSLIATYGVDTGSLESQWRRYVKRKYGWTVLLTQSAFFLAVAGTLVAGLFLLRRRRDRKKLSQLRAAESPEAPPWWNEGGVEIIAHRGYSARAPENTLAAMELALNVGAGSLEFDIHATLDGVPVVIHDDDVARTTGRTGRVAEHTWEQLRELDAGSWFSPDFAGEHIPSLEEVLRSVGTRVNRLYIELKPHAFTPAQLHTVFQLLEQYNITNRCIIMSFDWPMLEQMATHSQLITIAYLADDEETFLHALERARTDGRAWVDCNYRILLKNPALARRAHELGVELAVYTVNDTASASALAAQGVNHLTTNEVEKMLRWAAGRSVGG